MFQNVTEDIRRAIGNEPTLSRRLVAVYTNLGLHAVLLYRLSRWLDQHHCGFLGLMVSYYSSVTTGAQISRHARIGKGFVILHPVGIVIGATTVMGDCCMLSAGNVIGSRLDGRRPTIGNWLWAGVGAKILGGICVGDRVQVGANAVVLHSLPDDVTAVGIPAQIVRGSSASPAIGRSAATDTDAADFYQDRTA